MNINKKMLELGSKRSIIREIFEFGKIRASEIGKENVYDFSLGNPSVKPPKKVDETIVSLVNNCNSTALHGYTSATGDLEVRKAITNNINKRFNVGINENLIYMTCGAAASLSITLRAILNEDEEVIVFAPFFTEYRVFIESAFGKVVVSNPLEKDFQIDLADFESKITPKTKAIILNSPNNPSGVVYNEQTIKGVCQILNKKSKEFGTEIVLISDEPYRELVYGDINVPYLMNYYNNCIVCYSFSKSLSLPGERIGYIAISPKLTEVKNVYNAICGAGRALGYVCAPSMFQKVIKECLDCSVDIESYKKNRDLLYNSLVKLGFNCIKPDGAFYLFVKSPSNDAFDMYEKAKQFNILIVPCDDFGIKGYCRISYCVAYDMIERSIPAFEKLAKVYKLN
ncbi:MAG: pyridoxal phosphate-dependent aminotransferase [Clostridia bacterium]|nr:pyridoxal phosphate-dependent aminotransferase [Clostridia bacterium]